MNAVDKIALICQHLSSSRICEELFPYLKYIIQECDNEDEFLVRLSNNLTAYLQTIGNLLPVLSASVQVFETMIIMEDPRVRASSIKGFRFLGNFIFDKVAEMILKLGTSDLQYGKISCSNLISVTIQDKTFRQDLFPHCSKICLLLLEDDSMLVKRAAVNALRFMWDSPNRNFDEAHLTVFSEKFLLQIQNKFENLQDNGLVYELLNQEFFSRFLALNTQEKKGQIQISLLNKLLFLLNESKKPQQNPNENFQPDSGVKIDQHWKVKYMICQNLNLILKDLLSPPFLLSSISKMKEWFAAYPLLGSPKPNSPDNTENGWQLLTHLIYGIYRNYVSSEMIEVRSILFEQLIMFCNSIENPDFQLLFASKIIIIINEFVLYEESFYVKMKTSSFLVLLAKISQSNTALKITNLSFPLMKFHKNIDEKKDLKPKTDLLPKKDGIEEVKIISPNEQLVKKTFVETVPMNESSLLEYCEAIYDCLGFDNNIEVYKKKLVFLRQIMALAPQSPKIDGFLKNMIHKMSEVPHHSNIKFKDESLKFLIYLISHSKPNIGPCYLTSPLLPFQSPKKIKSETQLITLTGRSQSKKVTDLENSQEMKLNQMNIKFALSSMYKGYLITLNDCSPASRLKPPHLLLKGKNSELSEMTSESFRKDLLEPLNFEWDSSHSKFKISLKEMKIIEDILISFAEDKTVTIRNKVIEAIISLAHIVSETVFEEMIERLLKNWITHKSYMYRISSIHLMALLSLIPQLKTFQKLFGNVVRNGLKEKVLNVKLCLLRLVGLINQIHPHLTRKSHQLKIMLGFFEGDIDKSVSKIATVIQNTFEQEND